MTIKNRMISLTSFQPKKLNNMTEFTKPSLRGLLQPIERSTQLTNKTILPLSNKPRRLLHINLLLKITMEESILNVKLMKRPMTHGCHSKKQTNSGDFSHRRKGVTLIKAINLSITFSYQSNLKPINLTIRPNFNCIDPSTTHSLLARWKRNKFPSTIIFKGLHFINHSLLPSRMTKCLMNIRRNMV
ncbi:hypothetical protein AAZV13_04G103300 [Glycine max]